MIFRQLFDRDTSTYTYLLADPLVGGAVLIDPVAGQEERDLGLIRDLQLSLEYVLETHVHADHVTSAGPLRRRTGARVVVGRDTGVEGADLYLGDGDVLRVGSLRFTALATPGHTDGCTCWHTGADGRVFTGDALLIRGCGRTDFQQGDARKLFASVTGKLFTLPDATLVFPGHDYLGRTASSIGEERRHNPRLNRDLAHFEAVMGGLDLAPPARIGIAVPANLRLGLP